MRNQSRSQRCRLSRRGVELGSPTKKNLLGARRAKLAGAGAWEWGFVRRLVSMTMSRACRSPASNGSNRNRVQNKLASKRVHTSKRPDVGRVWCGQGADRERVLPSRSGRVSPHGTVPPKAHQCASRGSRTPQGPLAGTLPPSSQLNNLRSLRLAELQQGPSISDASLPPILTEEPSRTISGSRFCTGLHRPRDSQGLSGWILCAF